MRLNTDNLPINIKAEFVTVNSFEEIIQLEILLFRRKIVFPINKKMAAAKDLATWNE